MLKNYFSDQNDRAQDAHVKREKAVAAILTIINSGAAHSGPVPALSSVVHELNAAADALQAALEKE